MTSPTGTPQSVAALLLVLLAAACASPRPTGHKFAVHTGVVGGPGAGAVVGISQPAWESDNFRYDLELDYVRQNIDAAAPPFDDGSWDQVRLGVRATYPPYPRFRWTGRTGIVWFRARGDASGLDGPGDYGGFYAGIGGEIAIGKHFVTGPDLMALFVDGEGSLGSAIVPQAAWRIGWQF